MAARVDTRFRRFAGRRARLWAVLAVVAWAGVLGSTALAQDAHDACPIPIVHVPSYGADPWLAEISVNELTQRNMGSVRFLSFLHPALAASNLWGDEYLLVGVSTEDGAEIHAVTLTVTDAKGRVVRSADASESADGRNPLELDRELAERVSSALTPLREFIRSHQRRIREQEPVAIAAIVTPDPLEFSVDIGEERLVRFELLDCDGYVLSERSVEIDVRGVGTVDVTDVTTDADGVGEFTYVSDEAGEATILLVHPYERPEGSMGVADGGIVSATVRGDVLVEQSLGAQGVEGRGRLVSCGGLGGAWSGESSLTFSLPEVQGTLTGGGSFTFPPEPVSGERTTASWSMTGTLVLPDVGGEVEFVGEWSYEVVLSEAEGAWTLASEGGTVRGSVVATIPEVGRIAIPMSWPLEHGPAAPVRFVGGLPECGQ